MGIDAINGGTAADYNRYSFKTTMDAPAGIITLFGGRLQPRVLDPMGIPSFLYGGMNSGYSCGVSNYGSGGYNFFTPFLAMMQTMLTMFKQMLGEAPDSKPKEEAKETGKDKEANKAKETEDGKKAEETNQAEEDKKAEEDAETK